MPPAAPSKDGSRLEKDDGSVRPAERSHEAARARRSCFGGAGISRVSQITELEIYYGTMFGSAERYARALAHEVAAQRRARVAVLDLDAFDEAKFARRDRHVPSRLVVFVVSTHFAGAPSPSAERFRDWINDLVDNPRVVVEAKAVESDSKAARTSTQHVMAHEAKSNGLWPFRRRREPLRGMQYAVFGVGDSVYLTFNAMGKFVDLKLKQLGAVRFHPLGLGDCSNDIETTFTEWKMALLAKLPPGVTQSVNGAMSSALTTTDKKASGAIAPVSTDPSVPAHNGQRDERSQAAAGASFEPPLEVIDNFGRAVPLDFRCREVPPHEVDASQLYTLYPSTSRVRSSTTDTRAPSPALGPRTPRIALFDREPFAEIEVVEMRPEYGTDAGARRAGTFCVHFLQPDTTYISVSTFALFPQNSAYHVTRIAEAFGFNLDAVIELVPTCVDGEDVPTQMQQLPFPTPCTVRTMLTEFLELRSVTREFVRAAAGFVVTSDEQAMLERLGSSEGSSDFRTQIVEQYKGILGLVEMAPTLQIPLEVFVNITPPIKPRFYSIASSPRVSPREVDIAVSMGVGGQPQGFCVSFLERVISLPPGTRVPVRGFVSWSRFQFPDDGVSPMVLIAMGVGVSAMRSIIQERLERWMQLQRSASQLSDKGTSTRSSNRAPPAGALPTLILFLGATSKDHVVFRHDLNHWEQQMIVKVYYAFSNDPRHARRRVYDAVTTRIDEIVDTVKSSNGSRIFVCGRVNLAHRIREIFEADQARRGGRWFDTIQASGRFIEEGFN